MPTFFDQPDALAGFVAANRSRAIAAGIDPYRYDEVTAGLTALRDWPEAFLRAAAEHRAVAERATAEDRPVSAAEAYRDAALWSHFATVLPDPDLDTQGRAAADSADALRRSLAVLDPSAEQVTGDRFTAILRRPTGAHRPPVVLLIPGMNSGKVEFMPIAEALLRRGAAVLAIDGPGQGELATTSSWEPDYHVVVAAAVDAVEARGDLDAARLGAMALSMGGFFGAITAAHEPRLRAVVIVSGLSALSWNELPPYVTETFVLRTGSVAAAREFARRMDLSEVAERITQPLRVLDGGSDVMPGITCGEPLARQAPRGEYVVVPEGNHLIENARWKWLPDTADWLVRHLS